MPTHLLGLGLPPGGLGPSLSTQHLMDALGHLMSSRTSSQMSEARAWMHFPGQSLTSAVWVI